MSFPITENIMDFYETISYTKYPSLYACNSHNNWMGEGVVLLCTMIWLVCTSYCYTITVVAYTLTCKALLLSIAYIVPGTQAVLIPPQNSNK